MDLIGKGEIFLPFNLKENDKYMSVFFPRRVRIDATWRCNLNCKHCQTGMFRGEDHLEDLSLLELKDLFDQLADVGTEEIIFLGGEPLLRKDLLEQLKHLKSLGIKSGITTNGLLIKNDIADYLMNITETSVTVSLDGPDQESHEFIRGNRTFERAIKGLVRLQSFRGENSKVTIGISSVLNQNNIFKAEEFLDLAKNLKVDYLILSAVHQVGNAREHWDDLSLQNKDLLYAGEKLARKILSDPELPEIQMNFLTPVFVEYLRNVKNIPIPYKQKIDIASFYECYIQCNGRVFPSQQCSEMFPEALKGIEKSGIKFEGNYVRDKPFLDIWLGKDFEKYRELMIQKTHIKNYNSCSSCKFSKTYCIPSPKAYLMNELDPYSICKEILSI